MPKRALKAGVDTVSGFGLKVFSPDDLDALHYATLEVLWDVGVKVESNEALEILHGGGARVELREDYGIVKFPNYIIEDSIRWAPRVVVFYARDPMNDYVVEAALDDWRSAPVTPKLRSALGFVEKLTRIPDK